MDNNGTPTETEAHTTTIDSELEREVWSAPRPEQTNIHLDETRTAQVINSINRFTDWFTRFVQFLTMTDLIAIIACVVSISHCADNVTDDTD